MERIISPRQTARDLIIKGYSSRQLDSYGLMKHGEIADEDILLSGEGGRNEVSGVKVNVEEEPKCR